MFLVCENMLKDYLLLKLHQKLGSKNSFLFWSFVYWIWCGPAKGILLHICSNDFNLKKKLFLVCIARCKKLVLTGQIFHALYQQQPNHGIVVFLSQNRNVCNHIALKIQFVHAL